MVTKIVLSLVLLTVVLTGVRYASFFILSECQAQSISILRVVGWVFFYSYSNSTYVLAVTCDFQRCGILSSVDSDWPVQPHFNLRNCSVQSVA